MGIVSQPEGKVHEIPGDKQDGAIFVIRFPEVMNVPCDALAGAPRVEVVGDGELRMGPHRGILAYGPEEIHISGGSVVVLVRGSGLELRAMTPDELLITGTITAVEFMR